MRLACVFVPRFPLAVERRRSAVSCQPSAVSGRPSVTYQRPATSDHRPTIVYSRTRVIEASPELADAWPGRALRQARALYPHALYIPEDPARYAEVATAMLRALDRIAPEVEPAEQGCAYVGVRGLERLYQPSLVDQHRTDDRRPTTDDPIAVALVRAVFEETGLLAAVGVAGGKFVARVAALSVDPGGVRVVREGDERRFLRDASVGLLPFEPEIAQRLRALALHTLGDIARLPRPAVEAQFRAAGARMWELANGIDPEPLRPRRTPEAITERLTFESPVVTSEALIMAARQLVRRLAVRLGPRSARRMHAQVLAEGRIAWERVETFRGAPPDETRLMLVLKTRLSALQLTEAVDTVAITLSEIGREPGRQARLLTETNPQLERLLEAVQEIRVRFGGPMVWRAVEVDPCSRHPEDRSILIPYDA
jgi:nucleotidyltransferase/DNA polymerase involved in DNA repair